MKNVPRYMAEAFREAEHALKSVDPFQKRMKTWVTTMIGLVQLVKHLQENVATLEKRLAQSEAAKPSHVDHTPGPGDR